MKKFYLFITYFLQIKIINAALFVSPSPTTTYCSYSAANSCDDSSYTQSLSPAFPFAGSNKSTIYVMTNGFIGLGTSAPAENEYCNNFSSFFTNIIAPLYQDLSMNTTGGYIGYQAGTGYYAITWFKTGPYFLTSPVYTFQAVLVHTDAVINGVTCQAGDIILSYDLTGVVNVSLCFPLVGVAWDSPSATSGQTYIFGADANGRVNSSSIITLRPYLHFRWTGTTYELNDSFPNLLINIADSDISTTFYFGNSLNNSGVFGSLPSSSRKFKFYNQDYECSPLIFPNASICLEQFKIPSCQSITNSGLPSMEIFNTDLSISTASQFIAESITDNYYAITWCASRTGFTTNMYAQMTWFDKATIIGSNTFNPGDIVFSYQSPLSSSNICPTSLPAYVANAGLIQNSSTYTPLSGAPLGQISTSFSYPTKGIRFRWDSMTNNYTQTNLSP